jgi:glycine/D-amino acid oxidase-like deaminating enzyme
VVRTADIAVVGAGLVGLATAHALATTHRQRVVVFEKEPRVAAHQSSHNSGVIHSGLYYAPGSARARLCTEGRVLDGLPCARSARRLRQNRRGDARRRLPGSKPAPAGLENGSP